MFQQAVAKGEIVSQSVDSEYLDLDVNQSQEIIYNFLLNLVKDRDPDLVLWEFKCLFFSCRETKYNPQALGALLGIVELRSEVDFIHTLKRSCYILINNWESQRAPLYITQLINGFAEINFNQKYANNHLILIKKWLKKFVTSQDYEDLILFNANKSKNNHKHWSDRYTSYLLVPQYADDHNSQEQKEAAMMLSQKLRYQFKFDLAMYTARSQCRFYESTNLDNPTTLGEDVLLLIKTILLKKGKHSPKSIANIFLQQTQGIRYKSFKISLKKYLLYGVSSRSFIDFVEDKLSKKLDFLYQDYEEETINKALILRTCNQLFDYLTTENNQEPSELFIYLMSQENTLTMVMLLLKIMLICPHSRNRLESRIAQLIKYYMNYPQQECQWVIDFFEVLNIALTVHADSQVQYNIFPTKRKQHNASKANTQTLKDYRIFSQAQDLNQPKIWP